MAVARLVRRLGRRLRAERGRGSSAWHVVARLEGRSRRWSGFRRGVRLGLDALAQRWQIRSLTTCGTRMHIT